MALAVLAGCAELRDASEKPPRLAVGIDGPGDGAFTGPPEVGDTVTLGLSGLEPGAGAEIHLTDDLGREWSYARLFADGAGEVEPFVFWYHGGVIGRQPSGIDVRFRPDPAFETFEEADAYFAERALTLTVSDLHGRVLQRRALELGPRRGPLVYPSDTEGVLMNALNVAEDPLHVTARNLPAGATISIAVVDNRRFWREGDEVRDITGPARSAEVETVRLDAGQTTLTVPVWRTGEARPGAYDIVLRVGDDFRDPRLRPGDIVSYGDDTGVVLFAIINGNIVIDASGRTRSAPAKFEFSDSFEKGEDVWGAVDPTDLPAVHPGGNYAAYHIVEDRDAAYWDGPAPALVDVSGGVEIRRVKYWCINASRANIWPSATQAEPIKGYDVVVDFGAAPAMNAADYVADNSYDKGTDFIDGYPDAGFSLFEDPSAPGPFTMISTLEHVDETGITGMPFDPMGMTGPNYLVDLAWGRIVYPSQGGGPHPPVDAAEPTYPVALFLHGRHKNCDSNGDAPGGTGSYEPPGACLVANRIPDLRGYDYILERLASHGVIAVSISAHEIQPDQGAWNYDLRGRLILKWLDLLRDWNVNGTDPFGGIFQGRLDLSRVALSGHSRGGEGVVAAEHLNDSWPAPHGIVAMNAIAPTDQNWLDGISYVPDAAPYYLIIPARDGDVVTMQGLRTYDRAYPDGAADRQDKMLATVYGANHNYFNTIWTDSAALGTPNPWAASLDEGGWLTVPGAFVMSAAEQRQTALTSIAAFFRRYLQGIDPYKEIFTGRLKPAALVNDQIFWTYQDRERLAVDNFEQRPADVGHNTLGGPASSAGFDEVAERHLWADITIYTEPPPLPPNDWKFYHDTLGLKLVWSGPATYETRLPGGLDASGFSHLSFRAAKKVTGAVSPGPDVNLFVNVEDGDGDSALWDLRTDQFDRIPHPYERGYETNQALLTGVRIPLRNFTQNNSGVDLDDLRRITIRVVSSGDVGVDDIEFGN